jgi:hypothetical protein
MIASPSLVSMFVRMERFRALPGARFESERLRHSQHGHAYYYAGHLGSVVSLSNVWRRIPGAPKIQRLFQEVARKGHLRVQLRLAKGGKINRGVHQCVLLAWEGSTEEFFDDGCHKNGNPKDNRLANLVWGDRKMNAQQREAHARARGTPPLPYTPDEEFGF